ncbi:MAG: DUF222 domain-containing protein [Acidimicrobiia bacterium]
MPELVAHVDVSTLTDGGDGRCHLEDGPALAVETARRLACDAGVVVMLEDPDGNPLATGNTKRTVPATLRRALHARDQGCRFPGCQRRAVTDDGGIDARNRDQALDIGRDTIDSRWDGTRLDVHETTSALVWEHDHSPQSNE